MVIVFVAVGSPKILNSRSVPTSDAVKSTNNDGKLEVIDIIEILDYCIDNGDSS